MTLALVALGVILIVVAGIKVSEHLRHPQNIDPPETDVGRSATRDPSSGSDRPAGADAEDPPTEVPNRSSAQPPTGTT
jgi:hypothetical protein